MTKAQPSAPARTCKWINKSKWPLNKKCICFNEANTISTTQNYKKKFTTALVRQSSSHDMQTIENNLKTENTKQKLSFSRKSGS